MKRQGYLVALIVTSLLGSCVTSGTHKKVLADLSDTQKKLQTTSEELQTVSDQKETLTKEKNEVTDKLTLAMDRNETLVKDLKKLGKNVELLSDEKSKLSEDRQRLEAELENLRRMRAAAEKRNQQYSKLLSKLRSMIDAGTLSVAVRKGLMLVQLSNDILFPPGRTKLKTEGVEAIKNLAGTIKEFKDRRFQVMGHSDNTPINTPRYPSNWELSTQRAIEVVKILVENGVPPHMITAGGQAEYDPLTDNETEENRAMNRRVEIIFVPTIEEMPKFDKEEEKKAAPALPQPKEAADPNKK